ncbi:hypothetical protein BDEG_26348 [Batrachochytrium dendrobatidis JEL423]|uniref:Uncharacterized protein n=1 Tax=Batrachochytrium dendrobatidis (strain JEL423) TaxID=403673 RepID=A0A177WST7_BATDL|nr:hypothetical protein BDEG_26348 [Batrachochytrium dendrobatidis JEL423]
MGKRDASWTMSTADFAISKSSYYYYMEYYAFMSKYPKFQTLAVSFRVFRSMIPKIKEWFMSQECQALNSSDFYSEHYWMNVDDEMDDDDMNVLNEHNSTAVENNNWQQLLLEYPDGYS